jgi:IS5 family transposase
LIWKELQKQIDEKGYVIQGGTIQDATFILSDPGKKKKSDQQGGKEKKGQDVAATNTIQIQDFDKELLDISNNIKTSIIDPKKSNGDTINEGSWAKKGSKSYFGYKAHIMIDVKNHLIRTFEMTTASVHDSQIDLGIEGLPNYRDKGYYGAESCGYPATMKKATRGHKLETKDILRNKRISKKRSYIERCFGFMKRAHNAGHVCVTTIKRTAIKFMMNSMIYNLEQLKYLANKKPA